MESFRFPVNFCYGSDHGLNANDLVVYLVQEKIMVFGMRKIPGLFGLAVFGAVLLAPSVLSLSNVQAQVAESDQPYTPSGHMFDANRDGSKVASGSKSEIESRADVYESDNYRRQLEAQARREHIRRFSGHDFNRPSGPYNDY